MSVNTPWKSLQRPDTACRPSPFFSSRYSGCYTQHFAVLWSPRPRPSGARSQFVTYPSNPYRFSRCQPALPRASVYRLAIKILPSNSSLSRLTQYSLKRAPPRQPLAWPSLVCNGGIFLEKIKAALERSGAPGRKFSSGNLDNGWTAVLPFPRAIPATILDKYWASAFPVSKGKKLEIKSINVKQDKNYQTNDGTQITVS